MALRNEGSMFTFTPVAQGSPEWLELRRQGVGGSDVAALMGLSPWKSPYALWAEKRGLIEPEDISGRECVQMGHELEPDIREMYKRRHPGRRVQAVNGIARSIGHPCMQASLDGIVRDPELGTGVLEIKTASSQLSWADGVPVYYQTQVLLYLAVTGYAFADVAALVSDHGARYREFRIVADDPGTREDMALVVRSCEEFWRMVRDGTAPAMTGGPDEAGALQSRYPEQGEGMADATDAVDEAVRRWQEIAEAERALRKDKARAQDEIKEAIGDGRGIHSALGDVTWSRYATTRIDTRRLRELWPDAYRDCVTESMTGRLNLGKARK